MFHSKKQSVKQITEIIKDEKNFTSLKGVSLKDIDERYKEYEKKNKTKNQWRQEKYVYQELKKMRKETNRSNQAPNINHNAGNFWDFKGVKITN